MIRKRKGVSLLERFDDAYVPVLHAGCWLWIGTEKGDGYGCMGVNGRMMIAHRIAWILHRGNIPNGMFVCHKCDTPACVNPDHLFLGTPADNSHDRDKKGRTARTIGAVNGRAKLTWRDIERIKQDRHTAQQLASEYGVSPSAIYNVRSGYTWSGRKRQTQQESKQ